MNKNVGKSMDRGVVKEEERGWGGRRKAGHSTAIIYVLYRTGTEPENYRKKNHV